MKYVKWILFLCGIIITTAFSCEKQKSEDDDCGCEGAFVKQYEQVSGIIMVLEDTIYHIQLQSSDGKIGVLPCGGLSNEFKEEGLKVTVSGVLRKRCLNEAPNIKIIGAHPFTLENIQLTNTTN